MRKTEIQAMENTEQSNDDEIKFQMVKSKTKLVGIKSSAHVKTPTDVTN